MTYATRWNRDRSHVLKGHPERDARRQRAAERLAAHVYDPARCKPGCPKADMTLRAPAGGSTLVSVLPSGVGAAELPAGSLRGDLDRRRR